MPEERSRALESAVSQIKKQYGDGAVMRLGEATHLAGGAVPTGARGAGLGLGGGGGARWGAAERVGGGGAVEVVVVDSVAALVPRPEIEGDMGDATMGMQARLMSQALRKLAGGIKQTNYAVGFTNQLGEGTGGMFGNPETTTGGMALKFYASGRIDVRRVERSKGGQGGGGN